MHQCCFTYTILSQKSVYTASNFQRYILENREFRIVTVADVFYLYHNVLSVALMYNTANVREVKERSKERIILLIYFSTYGSSTHTAMI